MEFFTAYNRPPRVSVDCGGESATQQQFAQECDINYIVKRAQRTGVVPVAPGDLVYGVDSGASFQDNMNNIARVREYFDGLPSDIRLRFGNSLSRFMDFMGDESNLDEMVKLGLVIKDNPHVHTSVPVADGQAPQVSG